jgi:hypothetical protein
MILCLVEQVVQAPSVPAQYEPRLVAVCEARSQVGIQCNVSMRSAPSFFMHLHPAPFSD